MRAQQAARFRVQAVAFHQAVIRIGEYLVKLAKNDGEPGAGAEGGAQADARAVDVGMHDVRRQGRGHAQVEVRIRGSQVVVGEMHDRMHRSAMDIDDAAGQTAEIRHVIAHVEGGIGMRVDAAAQHLAARNEIGEIGQRVLHEPLQDQIGHRSTPPSGPRATTTS